MKTEQERIDYLADRIRNFTLAISYGGGDFIEPEGAGFPGPIPPSTGACCVDGSCSSQTESACVSIGGVYRGDGSVCDSVVCCGGFFIEDVNVHPVYFRNADFVLYRHFATTDDSFYVFVDASWSVAYVDACPDLFDSVGFPSGHPQGCIAGLIDLVSATGTFINHDDFSVPEDLTCALAIDSGGLVPCLKWGSPSPPEVNCCCGGSSVDAQWLLCGDACSGLMTESRGTDFYIVDWVHEESSYGLSIFLS